MRCAKCIQFQRLRHTQVSFLYRRHVAPDRQSPLLSELAHQIDAPISADGGCLHAPPAIYRWDGRATQIIHLAQAGVFDMILLPVCTRPLVEPTRAMHSSNSHAE